MTRFQRSLAVLALVACVAMALFSLVSLVAPGAEHLQDRPGLIDVLIFSAVFLMFPVVGLVVAWSRPDHPVGWLFLVIGFSILVSVFATEYAGRAVFAAADLPAVPLVAWIGGWAWLVMAGFALPLTIILFPDGRLPGPRWRPFVWTAMAAVGLAVVAAAIDPRPIGGYDGRLANPFRIDGPMAMPRSLSPDSGLW